MSRAAGLQGRTFLPEPGQSTAPDSAILRLPGIGGLRLLHCTHGDHAGPVASRIPHRHDLWHCVVYASGSGTCIHDGREVCITAPSLILTAPGQLHSFSRLPGEDTVYHEVTFAPERPGATAGWYALLRAWTGTDCPVPGHGPCSAACAADVGAVAARMAGTIRSAPPQAAVLLQGLLAELLLTVFRHGVAETERAAPDDPLETARRFVEAHAEDAIDLGAVARAAGLSAKHLGRAFAARYGQPPMRYRRSVLMRRAAVLLRTSDDPIERVAARLGYDDWRYFSRCFSAEHGVSPAAYRRAPRPEPTTTRPASGRAR
jgi:AraC-like DNA-binding protein